MSRLLCIGLILLGSFFPFRLCAQQYDRMWKQVEDFQKKDLVESVIESVDGIYRKAKEERNLPQLMKAFLVRSSYRIALTPDSLEAERLALEKWVAEETDSVGKAVLNNLLGTMALEEQQPDWEKAIHYFRQSLVAEELLGKTPAKEFRPMTVSESFSERYFDDNLFDLLVRRAIFSLSNNWSLRMKTEVQAEILALYERLMAFYDGKNRNAALLTRTAYLMTRSAGNMFVMQYRLENQEIIRQLTELAETYRGEEACADVYLKLAYFYKREQQPAKQLEAVRIGLELYPKSDLREALQQQVDEVLASGLSIDIPWIYPSHEVKMTVHYKNLKKFTLEWYRLEISPTAFTGDTDQPEQLIRQKGKKAGSCTYTLTPATDYLPHDTVLTYQVPEAGIYLLKLIPEGDKKGISYTSLFVSPYQLVAMPVNSHTFEVTAVDRLNGSPIPYAEIVTYTRESGQFVQEQVYPTDAEGKVLIPLAATRSGYRPLKYMHVRTPGNDFMAIGASALYGGNFHEDEDSGWKQRVALFSDRSLYRPGQILRLSGVVYRQLGDSLEVIPAVTRELSVYGGGKEVAKVSVRTDEYGVFTVDIPLPMTLLPGIFRATVTGEASLSFRIEEYKRPTFGVELSPYQAAYQVGDSLQISGEARFFSGAPVREAKVSYRVIRSKNWFWRGSFDSEELADGELQTDAEGKFAVPVWIKPPADADKEGNMIYYYNYRVMAAVTENSGETQEGSTDLPVGHYSIGLDIKGLGEMVPREKQLKIQFQALNLNRQPVNVEVEYQVYALDKDLKQGKLCYEGRAMSQQSWIPVEIWALPSGRYRMVATATDEQNRKVQDEQNFVLFSLDDTRLPVPMTDWFYQDGDTLTTDHPATVYIGSAEDSVHLFVDVYRADRRIESRRIVLNREIRKFTFPYRKEYGDGISVSFVFLREDRLYSHLVRLTRPKPDKKLVLKWETFRDRLEPGGQETWTLRITDPTGKPVNAHLLASLYDASLDRIYQHGWQFSLPFNRYTPFVQVTTSSAERSVYLSDRFPVIVAGSGYDLLASDTYSRLTDFSAFGMRRFQMNGIKGVLYSAAAPMARSKAQSDEAVVITTQEGAEAESAAGIESLPAESDAPVNVLRTPSDETAFYYPDLHTDSLGQVSIRFTVPEGLTEWRFLGFAHTESMEFGLMDARTRTVKEFMVQPNLPRYVRVGDEAVLSASLVNLSMETVAGKAWMELSDPVSGQVICREGQAFEVAEGNSGTVRFTYKVADKYDVLVCRIWADAGDSSDGEQHYLPVLSDREWVTETIPVQLNGEESVTVSLKSLFNGQSRTAADKRLTVELTANPIWYAIQALPVVGTPASDDAISWMTAYYTNALSKKLVADYPQIAVVLETWKKQPDSETWLSNLQKNTDLKGLLLEETPWLSEAEDETDRKRNLAVLLDENAMESRLQAALRKLESLQGKDGGWSWYPGMDGNRYVTTEMVKQLARLIDLQVPQDEAMKQMYRHAQKFLGEQLLEEYQEMREVEKRTGTRPLLSDEAIVYLYVCALDASAKQQVKLEVLNYFLETLQQKVRPVDCSILDKARIAVVLKAFGKQQAAMEWLQSVREYTVYSPEMGRYYDTPKAVYSWCSYRIPTQVAAMEAIRRLAPDEQMLAEMKQWLLKEKQVQAWPTPVATADALYALLGDETRIQAGGEMKAQAGGVMVSTASDAVGYVRETLPEKATDVPVVKVTRTGSGWGWGAVYAQYTEQLDAMEQGNGSGNGLTIQRKLLKEGKEIDEHTPLRMGDRLTVCLTVRADRDMDFVQITDGKAACMEPVEQLSGYRWQAGVGYYQVSRDASMQFFIDRLRKGVYTIRYEVYLDRSGTYRGGTAVASSVYAPEFRARTGSLTIRVND